MKFRESTDRLFKCVSHADLARRLDVSVASVRQARLRADAKAHREPPEGWEKAVAVLAAEQIRRYQKLISDLSIAAQRQLFDEPNGSR